MKEKSGWTISILQVMEKYISSVRLSRSMHTASTYSNGLKFYVYSLLKIGINPETTPIENLSEDTIISMAADLKNHAATTERLYLTAVSGFFEFHIS